MKDKLLKNKIMTEEEKSKLNQLAKMLATNWMSKPEIMSKFKMGEDRLTEFINSFVKKEIENER